jgi:hypothetical protein
LGTGLGSGFQSSLICRVTWDKSLSLSANILVYATGVPSSVSELGVGVKTPPHYRLSGSTLKDTEAALGTQESPALRQHPVLALFLQKGHGRPTEREGKPKVTQKSQCPWLMC